MRCQPLALRNFAFCYLLPAFSPLRLAILGPGLIGGSLALASRHRGLCSRLSVWSPSAAEREAVRFAGWADEVTADPTEAVTGAELVLLCTPPGALPPLAARIAPHLAATAAVSDVASVKGALVAELTEIFAVGLADTPSRYVGGHPMAGAERGGLPAARADLFEERVCLLTPLPARTDPAAVALVAGFWTALGARVRCLPPGEHDEAVALVSHLPHLLAAVLADYVGGQPGHPLECAGPGWRDMTRLAGGNPDLWTEILSRNRVPVTNALRGALGRLRDVLGILETGSEADLKHFLEEAQRRRGEPSP